MELGNFQLVKQGAEARIYQGLYLGRPTIAKERFVKTYRHPDLDSSLTKERIKAEVRAIGKCKSVGILTPAIYSVDFQRRIIFMEQIENSVTLKEYINSSTKDERKSMSSYVGTVLGKMHSSNIVHGDLTTSNMLVLNQKDGNSDFKVALIDFGLSRIDTSAESKGVDLYVLERALISTHSTANEVFPLILDGYKKGNKNGNKQVLHKLEEVRARGRKRTMVG